MYFSNLFSKLSELGHRHQILFAVIAGFAIICVTWGTEKLLELYVPKDKAHGYLSTVITGLIILWVVQHFIMQVL